MDIPRWLLLSSLKAHYLENFIELFKENLGGVSDKSRKDSKSFAEI